LNGKTGEKEKQGRANSRREYGFHWPEADKVDSH
jgi:hypothetical protein